MPVRLPFIVVACSGEDPEYPCRELQFNAPESRGWCTPRNCHYPQEFVVKLDQPAQLFQIQLLSHEFKIAAKVEIQVGVLPEGAGDLGRAHWKRLGHLSFDPNERSQLSARELKSVVLGGVPAHLVRFQFARCHCNRLNLHDQVGIIALNLLGEPLAQPLSSITNTAPALATGASLASLSLGAASFGQPWAAAATAGAPPPPFAAVPGGPALQQSKSFGSFGGTGGGSAAELAAELNVDVVTAQRILELQDQKKQAIDREDYDEAKRLKAGIDKLRAAGLQIAQLEARKRAAVDQEDYDMAKELKMQVDRLRASAYATALTGEVHFGAINDGFKSPVPSRRGSLSGSAPPGGRRGGGEAEEDFISQPAASRGAAGPRADPSSGAPAAAARVAAPAAAAVAAAPRSESWVNYDDRPAQAKGVYNFDSEGVASAPPPGARRTSGAASGRRGSASGDAGPAPPSFPPDLPAPDQLTPADAKDAQPLVELLGEYTTRALYSKAWQLREAALQKVAADISGGKMEGLDGNSEAFKTLASGMARPLKDKVAGVFAAALKVLRELVGCQASKCHARDVQTAMGELLPVLVEKASDLNARIKEQATELLVFLAGVKQVGLASSTYHVVKPVKSQTGWKVVLGRLQLLSALLPVVGMAGRSGNGFQLDAVMEFVGTAFGNSSAEVRGAAVQLALQVFDLVGPTVQRYLPADLNPKVKEQIEQGMINRPAASAVQQAAMGGAGRAGGRPAAPQSAAPGARKATAAVAAPAAGGGSPAIESQGATAGGTSLLGPQQGSRAYPSSPGSPGMPPPGDDDPAPFEAELKSREARLGSSHPDVAEALSNLAIIYNQRGDTARALPLYERALAIWEATCGSDHPDVAHTLTDIAVIHLEQGRDDIGRPLLERALAIQEKQLGPDHPDVVAIRDVLNEEV